MGVEGGAPQAELAAAAPYILTPYSGLGGFVPSAQREMMALAIRADILSWEVLHVLPSSLAWSIPDPPHLAPEAFSLIMLLSDKLVQDSLERFTCR